MKFKPLNHHVEIEPIKQTAFLSSSDSPYEEKGKVISVADGVTLVSVGEVVYFDSWLVARYEDTEKNLRYLVPEENIRAVETDVQTLSK